MSRTWHKKRIAKLSGSKRFDWSCRNHGGCCYCEENRLYFINHQAPADELEQLEVGYVADGTERNVKEDIGAFPKVGA